MSHFCATRFQKKHDVGGPEPMFLAPGTPKGARGPNGKFVLGSVLLFNRFGTKKGDPKEAQKQLFLVPFSLQNPGPNWER